MMNADLESMLQNLNQSQREAVTYSDGPSLVIAGAGSGKTRVLTCKIAYLMAMNNYRPWQIMALTFTNKAAHEMKERIVSLVGPEASQLWMGTFHSVFCRILRAEAETLGFNSNFTIYDTADSKNLLKTIMREMNIDDKVKPADILARISTAKNRLMSPLAYAESATMRHNDQMKNLPHVAEIYTRYAERCRKGNAMDFDDLLFHTYFLFRNHDDIRRKYAERFRFVLVDEYQDTNYAQHCIVQQLAQEHQHVCVVGDDAQSIYSFRGADIGNILNFQSVYANSRLFRLEQNYRSTKTIVNAANSLIAKNKKQIPKKVFSENEEGEPIRVKRTHSDVEEALFVCNELAMLHRKGQSYSQMAVLYRTNAQSRTFEEVFRKGGIPYIIYGGLSFYQRKEVKDVMAYFRLLVNPHDEEAFKRVVNYPARGIGNTTLQRVVEAATRSACSLWQVLCQPEECGLNVNRGTQAKLQAFRNLVQGFIDRAGDSNAEELGRDIIRQTGIMNELYADTSPEGQSRRENIDELVASLHDFVESHQEEGDSHIGIADYLAEVSLLTDLDAINSDDATERVTLMTVHAAKGLEFDQVFVVGLESGLFPSDMADDNPFGMEEERRLLYVAITRARKQCFLSYATMRYRYGQLITSSPSPFINEIDSRWLDSDHGYGARSHSMNMPRKPSASLFRNPEWPPKTKPRSQAVTATPRVPIPDAIPASPSNAKSSLADGLYPGRKIEHDRFGQGVVLSVEGEGEFRKIQVRFQLAGTKQLLLKYARVTLLDD